MKKYSFANSEWEKDFEYSYSLVANSYNKFTYADGHVYSGYNEEIKGHDYVSIVHGDVFHSGAEIAVKCSFDKFGAPLITIANWIEKDADGKTMYGDHYEVVAYKDGCNIWYITKAPEGHTRPFLNIKCASIHFPIEEGSTLTLSVKVLNKMLCIELNGVRFDYLADKLADDFRLGITGCEGVNRFYCAEICEE